MESRFLKNGNVEVTVPIEFNTSMQRTRMKAVGEPLDSGQFVKRIATGIRWQSMIDSGKYANAKQLAETLGVDQSRVNTAMRMSMLSPRIIHRLIEGDVPDGMTVERMKRKIPILWEDQERLFYGRVLSE